MHKTTTAKKFVKYGLAIIPSIIALSFAPNAQALDLSINQSFTTGGQKLDYNFTGLPASDGSDGTLRLFTPLNGFDLSDGFDLETFELFIDGTSVGNFGCGTNTNFTDLQGDFDTAHDCKFDATFSINGDFGLNLPSLVADGSLLVEADFLSEVNASINNDHLTVQLLYSEPATPVPFEASPTLGIFLVGVGFAVKRGREIYKARKITSILK